MKKTIFVILISMISTIAFGQFTMGIKGAFAMNSLSTDGDDIEQAIKAGVQGGLFFRIGDKTHLQPEAYFSLRSGELSGSFQGLNVDEPEKSVKLKKQMTLTTVDIPILIGYKLLDPPTMNLRVQAGPVISMVMNKKFDVTTDGLEADGSFSDAFEEEYKDANWGLQVGAGADFLFLTLDVRYELGLTDIYESSEASGVDFGSLKNNMFIVSVGWKFM